MQKRYENLSGEKKIFSKHTWKLFSFIFFFLQKNGKEQRVETCLTSPSLYFGKAAAKGDLLLDNRESIRWKAMRNTPT